MCPTRRTIVSAVRLRTETGPSAGMDRTATPWVALTWAITGRRAVCSGRSVTHTARCQPRSRSILRPAAISALRSVGGCTSRSETNSTRHRTPGSCPASRSAISPTRLSVSSDAGPGEASRPMTSSGCGSVSAPLSEPGPSATIPFTTTEVMFARWRPAHITRSASRTGRVPASRGVPDDGDMAKARGRRRWQAGTSVTEFLTDQPRPLTLSAYGETARWLSTVATPGAAAAAARAAAASCSECTWP